jgi:nicotinamide mononucleotide transporter
VWLATRQNIISWPLGLINVVLFFVLFFQVNLYSGMLLQAFFFATNIYGWIIWKKQLKNDEKPQTLSMRNKLFLTSTLLVGTILLGFSMQKLPVLFPQIINSPASQPYYDAFVAVSGIIAQVLLTRRIYENWHVWIVVNTVSAFVLFRQGLYLLTIEYLVFLVLAIQGVISWNKTIEKKEIK